MSSLLRAIAHHFNGRGHSSFSGNSNSNNTSFDTLNHEIQNAVMNLASFSRELQNVIQRLQGLGRGQQGNVGGQGNTIYQQAAGNIVGQQVAGNVLGQSGLTNIAGQALGSYAGARQGATYEAEAFRLLKQRWRGPILEPVATASPIRTDPPVDPLNGQRQMSQEEINAETTDFPMGTMRGDRSQGRQQVQPRVNPLVGQRDPYARTYLSRGYNAGRREGTDFVGPPSYLNQGLEYNVGYTTGRAISGIAGTALGRDSRYYQAGRQEDNPDFMGPASYLAAGSYLGRGFLARNAYTGGQMSNSVGNWWRGGGVGRALPYVAAGYAAGSLSQSFFGPQSAFDVARFDVNNNTALKALTYTPFYNFLTGPAQAAFKKEVADRHETHDLLNMSAIPSGNRKKIIQEQLDSDVWKHFIELHSVGLYTKDEIGSITTDAAGKEVRSGKIGDYKTVRERLANFELKQFNLDRIGNLQQAQGAALMANTFFPSENISIQAQLQRNQIELDWKSKRIQSAAEREALLQSVNYQEWGSLRNIGYGQGIRSAGEVSPAVYLMRTAADLEKDRNAMFPAKYAGVGDTTALENTISKLVAKIDDWIEAMNKGDW